VGLVACEKHGPHSGPLCCDHVREAVYGSGPVIAFENHRFDVLEDGSELLDHMLCSGCAAKFGLSAAEFISHEVWGNQERFPYVCPVCEKCFEEWTSRSGET
jgi:hypothetical protein